MNVCNVNQGVGTETLKKIYIDEKIANKGDEGTVMTSYSLLSLTVLMVGIDLTVRIIHPNRIRS